MILTKKAGMQITATFLVSLIVGIVLFAFGLSFIYSFQKHVVGDELDKIDATIEAQIKNSVTNGKIVYVYEPRRYNVKPGSQISFPVGIYNVVGVNTNFKYKVEERNNPSITLLEPHPTDIDEKIDWVLIRATDLQNEEVFSIGAGDYIASPFAIYVPKKADPKTYTFVVRFEIDDGTGFYGKYQYPILVKIDVV